MSHSTRVHALLDCGASTSRLPLDMVKKIVELIGGTAVVQPDHLLYNSTKPIFMVPKQVNDNKRYLGITYHFQGSTTEDIVVGSRPTWFISDENSNGLIWARKAAPLVAAITRTPLPPQGGAVTFGINWFNSLIVAMFDHLRSPFLRLSQQNADNHTLPPFVFEDEDE